MKKPHIFRYRGIWYCERRGRRGVIGLRGFGESPSVAFLAWEQWKR